MCCRRQGQIELEIHACRNSSLCQQNHYISQTWSIWSGCHCNTTEYLHTEVSLLRDFYRSYSKCPKKRHSPPPPGTLNSNMFSGVDGLSLGNLLRTWRTEKIPGTCHYSRRGVAPEIKGLGKQHFEWIKGWANQNETKQLKGWEIKRLLSLPKHDSPKYWRLKNNVNSRMSIQCKSIKVTILIIFRFVGRQMVCPNKVHVQITWNFRLQKIAQAFIKLTEVVKDMRDTEWYPFLIDIWGWVKLFSILFNCWISKMFTKKNISLRCYPPS